MFSRQKGKKQQHRKDTYYFFVKLDLYEKRTKSNFLSMKFDFEQY